MPVYVPVPACLSDRHFVGDLVTIDGAIFVDGEFPHVHLAIVELGEVKVEICGMQIHVLVVRIAFALLFGGLGFLAISLLGSFFTKAANSSLDLLVSSADLFFQVLFLDLPEPPSLPVLSRLDCSLRVLQSSVVWLHCPWCMQYLLPPLPLPLLF